jgi:Protein of unknown function (DUF2815).
MAKQQNRPKYVSPKGVFSYPRLTEPDTKFKDEGEYSVFLILDKDSPEAKKLMAQIDAAAAESLKEAKANAKNAAEAKKWETKYLPYTDVEDEETGEPTGQIKVKFTMKASGVNKKTGKPWTRKPAIFDAKGKPITGDIKIGGGTIGKVSYEIIPYAPTTQVGASVKLGLEAVQIIELREWGERSADSYGFGEEDGYSHDEANNDHGFDDESDHELTGDEDF